MGAATENADFTHDLEDQVVVEAPYNEVGRAPSMITTKVWRRHLVQTAQKLERTEVFTSSNAKMTQNLDFGEGTLLKLT